MDTVSESPSEIFSRIVGQPCLRSEVGAMRSLSLGFGELAENDSPNRNRQYRLWELGTYSSHWQIVEGSVILLAKHRSMNPVELDASLEAIELGRFAAIRQLSKTDLQLELDNGVAVNFFGKGDVDDEYFHVRGPQKLYVEFSEAGWKVGRSDEPWTSEATASPNG
jgi:hypothetical protein